MPIMLLRNSGQTGYTGIPNRADYIYLMFEVYGFLSGSCAEINEIQLFFGNTQVLCVSQASPVYDEATGGIPHYWTGWGVNSYPGMTDGITGGLGTDLGYSRQNARTRVLLRAEKKTRANRIRIWTNTSFTPKRCRAYWILTNDTAKYFTSAFLLDDESHYLEEWVWTERYTGYLERNVRVG